MEEFEIGPFGGSASIAQSSLGSLRGTHEICQVGLMFILM